MPQRVSAGVAFQRSTCFAGSTLVVDALFAVSPICLAPAALAFAGPIVAACVVRVACTDASARLMVHARSGMPVAI